MATLTYDGVEFAATFGCLPIISTEIGREVDAATGDISREVHVITLEGHIIAVGADTDARQDDLAAKMVIMEGLSQDAELIWGQNDGGVFWAYNSAGTANNHITPIGIKLSGNSFPAGPAKGVTNVPYTLRLVAPVFPCSNDPITGISFLVYSVTEEWVGSEIRSITYSGTICACEGGDVRTLVNTLRDDIFGPDAAERAVGQVEPGTTFDPIAQTITELDRHDTCVGFSFRYAAADLPTGLDAEFLRVSVQCSIVQNLVRCEVTGVYTYRGTFTGSGVADPIPQLFFGPGGGAGTVVFGVGTGTYGLAGATETFQQVKREAFAHAGIDPKSFLPPGAGSIFLVTEPRISFDTSGKTITSTKTYMANWIHDGRIVLYDESVEIQGTRQGFTAHRLTVPNATITDKPLCYVQTSGRGAYIVTFTIRIVAVDKYYDVPERLDSDDINVWRIEADRHGASHRRVQQARGLTAAAIPSFWESRIVQTYGVRDIDNTSPVNLKAIVLGNVAQVGAGGALITVVNPAESGSLAGQGGFA